MKKVMERTFRRMNANRKNGKKALKGFTLVEIIVVLVILAILAAAMIPALTGYIDKANEKTAIAEARNVVTAAQTLASEEYALHGGAEFSTWFNLAKAKEILDLADVSYDDKITQLDKFPLSSVSVSAKGKVTNVEYKTAKGYTVSYDGTEFAIS